MSLLFSLDLFFQACEHGNVQYTEQFIEHYLQSKSKWQRLKHFVLRQVKKSSLSSDENMLNGVKLAIMNNQITLVNYLLYKCQFQSSITNNLILMAAINEKWDAIVFFWSKEYPNHVHVHNPIWGEVLDLAIQSGHMNTIAVIISSMWNYAESNYSTRKDRDYDCTLIVTLLVNSVRMSHRFNVLVDLCQTNNETFRQYVLNDIVYEDDEELFSKTVTNNHFFTRYFVFRYAKRNILKWCIEHDWFQYSSVWALAYSDQGDLRIHGGECRSANFILLSVQYGSEKMKTDIITKTQKMKKIGICSCWASELFQMLNNQFDPTLLQCFKIVPRLMSKRKSRQLLTEFWLSKVMNHKSIQHVITPFIGYE